MLTLMKFLIAAAIAVGFCGFGCAQEPATVPGLGYEDSFQIGFFTNGALGGGGSVFFPFTNAGFHVSPGFPVVVSDICVNAYIIASDGSMASCCGCRVPADAFVYILDAPYNYPDSNVTVKLIATLPEVARGQTPSRCTPQSAPASGLGIPLGYASGMRAWTESQSDLTSPFFEKQPFSPAPLGDGELATLTQQCTTARQCTCLPGALLLELSTSLSVSKSRNPFGIR